MATRRGDIAKQSAINTIIQAFGDNYVTQQDKKIYVFASDGPGTEKVQLAISITMPKVQVTCGGAVPSNDGAWPVATSTNPAANQVSAQPTSVQLSDEDKAKVDELMKALGL